MLITDVQERIKDVFSRATKSLSKEFQEICKNELLEQKTYSYKSIENDFKNYSSLAADILAEVNSNLSSNLRPSEREKYINNLNSYTYWLRDGYNYIESDEWVDQILTDFQTIFLFNTDRKKPRLTEDDKKIIYKIVEEVRVCCYEYLGAADIIDSTIRDYLVGHTIVPSNTARTIVSSRESETSKFEKVSYQETQPKTSVEDGNQLKTNSKNNLTENFSLPTLTSIVNVAKILNRSVQNSSLGMNFSIEGDIIKHTDYFLIENKSKWTLDYNRLNNELTNWFLQQTDSKIQDRFANHLIDLLFDLFGPLWDGIDSIIDYYTDLNRHQSQDYIDHNGSFCDTIKYTIYNWAFCIRKNILTFAPERYAEHKSLLDRLIPYFDKFGDQVEQPPQPIPYETGVKLQWNGTNDSLYDLFAQLSLVHITPGKPLLNNTIEGLAKFLSSNVEGMPSVETIERRIRAFREPQGQTPKRGRIDIHVNKEKP